MAEVKALSKDFFARGIDSITRSSGRFGDEWSDLPDLTQLSPTYHVTSSALKDLLPANQLERDLDQAIQPIITTPDMLLPSQFSRVLDSAHQALIAAGECSEQPGARAVAAQVLAQAIDLRMLFRTNLSALHQA